MKNPKTPAGAWHKRVAKYPTSKAYRYMTDTVTLYTWLSTAFVSNQFQPNLTDG
jgi:hypothetical protein